MKKQLLFLSMLGSMLTIGSVKAQNITFTDERFKQSLLDQTFPVIDTNEDGEISFDEARMPFRINAVATTSLPELRHFVNLEELTFNFYNGPSIDVSALTKLTFLNIRTTQQLTDIDLSNNPLLEALSVGPTLSSDTKLESANLSNNPLLTALRLTIDTNFDIDLSRNPLLTEVTVTQAQQSNPVIDISNNRLITRLVINSPNLNTGI